MQMKLQYAIMFCLLMGSLCLRSNAQGSVEKPYACSQGNIDELTDRIHEIIKHKRATIGVAVITDKQKLITVNGDRLFPLLSVFKFPVALAALDKMDRDHTNPDSSVFIKNSRLDRDTYSPLLRRYSNRDIRISLAELLYYSISLSDNNACDLLIDYIGGMDSVDTYIRNLGVDDIHLSATERDMHEDIQLQYKNTGTPIAAVRLLEMFYQHSLFEQRYKSLLINALVNTETGAEKLKGLLPAEAIVAHKTGSSDRTTEGVKIADNDLGVVFLPDGRKYYIAVFVTESRENDEVNARIIADISYTVYKFFTS